MANKQYERDTSGVLGKTAVQVMKEYEEFAILKCLNPLFTWKLGKREIDGEKQWVTAKTKKISARERDVYGLDVEICVHKDTWLESTKEQRFRIMFHELLHINVFLNEEMEIQKDEDGRPEFNLSSHDIRVLTFERELEVFGLPSQYKGAIRKLEAATAEDGRSDE